MNFKLFSILLLISYLGATQDRIGIETKNKYYPTQSSIDISETNETLFVTKFKDPATNKILINILGSPYYKNRGFKDGTIYLDGSEIVANITYNIANNDILLSPKGAEESTILIPDSFLVDNIKFVKLYPKYRNAYYKDYYTKVFEKNNVKLFKKINVSLQFLKKPVEIMYENNVLELNNSYVKSNTYFYSENKTFKEIKPNLKIFKLFGKRQKDIEKYILANNLNSNEEQHLIKILDYYAQTIFD